MGRRVSSMKPINTIDLTNLESSDDDDDGGNGSSSGSDSRPVIHKPFCDDTLLFSDPGDELLPEPPTLVSLSILSQHSHLPGNETPSTLSLSLGPSPTLERALAFSGSPVATAHSSKTMLIQKLAEFKNDLYETHSNAVCSALAQQWPVPNAVKTGSDLFAGLSQSEPSLVKPAEGRRIKTRTTIGDKKLYGHLSPIAAKSAVTAVPPYRSHLIEVPGNVLAPYAPLTHVPHIRDIRNKADQRKWQSFVLDLRQQAVDSGFNTYFEERRIDRIQKQERAVAVRAELEPWLQELNLPCINKSLLNLWNLYKTDEACYDDWTGLLGTDDTRQRLQDFCECFDEVFGEESVFSVPISLDTVLELDAYDPVSYSKLTRCVGEARIDKALETYLVLSCQECFSMSCEHGSFDSSFHLLQSSLVTIGASFSALQQKATHARPTMRLDHGTCAVEPCQSNCFLLPRHSSHATVTMRRDESPWTAKETSAFESLAGTIPRTRDRRPASCIAAVYLQRSCAEIHDYALKAQLFPQPLLPPPPQPPIETAAPILPWYDRFKKALSGDWQRKTLAHCPENLVIAGPCFHDGPCSDDNCPCVRAKQFCRAACACTVESCSYKFTGCACHASGTTCTARQKERPCVCLLLGRECDPELCGFCGVRELTMPENRTVVRSARATTPGCQNCDMQLGRVKSVVAGQSKIPNVGYGLFAAQDIADGDFVLEYMGERVAADEGIRRGARRGEGFGGNDEHAVCSYLFTLLEGEGTWVDAAVFGNKSRYINHAKETCNLVPRIVYVINAHRIKFVAKRDIRAGEELLFDYGSNFPNLVDLMDKDKANRQLKSSSSQDEELPLAEEEEEEEEEAPGYFSSVFSTYPAAAAADDEDLGSVYMGDSSEEIKPLPTAPRRRTRKHPAKAITATTKATTTAAGGRRRGRPAQSAAAQTVADAAPQAVQGKEDQGVFRSKIAGALAARNGQAGKRKTMLRGEEEAMGSGSSAVLRAASTGALKRARYY